MGTSRKCGDLGHKSKRTGEPCGATLRAGAVACKWHGGNSPQARARETERVTEQQIRTMLGRLTVRPIDDPLTELSRLAGEVVAWKELVADHVARLERLRYSGDGGEQIRGEITLFERALDRCATVLSAIARLNIDERLAKVSERQAEIVADALAGALTDMGLSREQQQEARRGLARRLHAVPRRSA